MTHSFKKHLALSEEEIKESTAAYADSLAKIAADKKLKGITSKDRETLVKLAALMSEEELDEFGSRNMSAADKDNLRRRLKNKK